MDLKTIFANNKKWAADNLARDKNFFNNIAKTQKPKWLYIGCSDSRVNPEMMMGLGPGEAFIQRNIANMVNNLDLNMMSVLDYAINTLKINHIIVCGHYGCGGIKAAMGNEDLGPLNPWVQSIKDVYRLHQARLDGIKNIDKRYRLFSELNVQEQCINLAKNPVIQRASGERGLKIHSLIFDISSGQLTDLKINLDEILREIKEIYQVHEK